MARPPKNEESWFPRAVELMVRQNMSLRQAADSLGLALSAVDAENILRRQGFQRLLWTARHRYHEEIASDPARTKIATIGLLQLLAQKLIEEGGYEKAADVIFKLMKAEGWVGAESNVNIFGNLTQRDLDELKKRVEKVSEKPSIN